MGSSGGGETGVFIALNLCVCSALSKLESDNAVSFMLGICRFHESV